MQALECWISYLSAKFGFPSFFLVCHSAHLAKVSKTNCFFGRNVQLSPKRLYCLGSSLTHSIDNSQTTEYRVAAFSPRRTIPTSVSRSLVLVQSPQNCFICERFWNSTLCDRPNCRTHDAAMPTTRYHLLYLVAKVINVIQSVHVLSYAVQVMLTTDIVKGTTQP